MFKFIKKLFSPKVEPKEYEWYCTRCGYSDIQHDVHGRLLGSCPEESEYACPLDLRVKTT